MGLFDLFKKKWDLQNDFTFGQRTHIDESNNEISDKERVLSTLSLIIRFFGICDKRQIKPMKDYLKDLFEKKILIEEDISSKGVFSHNQIWWDIKMTLNISERQAVDKLFGEYTCVLYLDTNEPKDGKVYSKYIYSWSYNNGQPQDKLNLSVGPDKVLLPLMVSMLIHFNSIKVQNEEWKNKMNSLGLALLLQIDLNRLSHNTGRDIINNLVKNL